MRKFDGEIEEVKESLTACVEAKKQLDTRMQAIEAESVALLGEQNAKVKEREQAEADYKNQKEEFTGLKRQLEQIAAEVEKLRGEIDLATQEKDKLEAQIKVIQ